jgi:hypothetical protein
VTQKDEREATALASPSPCAPTFRQSFKRDGGDVGVLLAQLRQQATIKQSRQ